MQERKTIFLVDGSNCFYRAFHAIPLFTNSAGMPTNAIYGFAQTIRKLLKDYAPDYIVVAFDVRGKTVRHEEFEQYKAHRPPMPDDLGPQIPYIKKLLKALNIASVELMGYEADDCIATLAKKAESEGLKVSIISGDKDLHQLVSEHTVILDYTKEKEYGPEEVRAKFGVGPDGIRDLLALAGDKSDNIPGVPGVGPKTAVKLLKRFGSFEAIFNSIVEVKGEKLKENLKTFKEQAEMSKKLTSLYNALPIDLDLGSFAVTKPDFDQLGPLFKELDFAKLYKEMLPSQGLSTLACTVVREQAELKTILNELSSSSASPVAFYFMTDGVGYGASITGVSIYNGGEAGWFLPVNRAEALPGGARVLSEMEVVLGLKAFMQDASIKKLTNDAKQLHIFLLRYGARSAGVEMDTSIASYLLNPSHNDHSIESIALRYLGLNLESLKQSDTASADFPAYLLQRAVCLYKANPLLLEKLESEGLDRLFYDMELPLCGVLARMESAGIKVDAAVLKTLSDEIAHELKGLTQEIYALSDCEFNINSPKQLAELLFDKLAMKKPFKRTKTGFSTDESVLKKLAADHPLPAKILRHRHLQKLKSTFVDALVSLINPDTGRIHTSFNQTVTATGRLSSSRPNLQNIPIRDDYSSRVREAFVAREGCEFLSADYSQIELRLVAHLSEDPILIEAFNNGEDIHTITASEVFSIMPALVTKEMRRRAKAINFGIIYGMGAFGLSNDLEIPVSEARAYIESYFAHYGAVKGFIDSLIATAETRGFTQTIFGRKRAIAELRSRSGPTRKFGERMAINTPVQGAAADMIKLAMIKVAERLEEGALQSRLILQVHDELILEVTASEKEAVAVLVKEEMEGVVELKVPVKVNIKCGRNWRSVV